MPRLEITTKRLIDLAFSLTAIILLSPLFVVIPLLIRITMGAPTVFAQQRPGKYGKIFTVYKYRTMTDARDAAGNLLPDDNRLTSFGRLLRKLSLDELPQLWNVVKGELSLVGPRPLLVKYLPLYTPEQARRHDVPPGITGWAQVNGRNAISWEKRFELDVWYVDNWSLGLDLKILFMTIIKVLKQDGINATKHVTMSEFLGTQRPGADV